MSLLAGHSTEDGVLAEFRARGVKKTKRTLRKWRLLRQGPPWTKLGRTVLYPDDDFIAWLKANTQRARRRAA
jgi:hypothetical protein